MKICPKCRKTYSDANLNFCLDDGTVLAQFNAPNDTMPATVMSSQPRPTTPPQFGNQSATPNNWNSPNQYAMQPPPKKSKAWLWVLGVLGGLMLICGGGFVGLVYYAANLEKNINGSNRAGNVKINYNSNLQTANKSASINKSSVQKIDLAQWADGDTDLGVTEYDNNQFLMGSKQKGYYYVLTAQAIYKTESATTKVTVRNVYDEKTSLGFGLIVHSNPVPLTQDYAFLIDSVNKKYRVVRHAPGSETIVVGWTRSTAIKGGTEKNTLEVRDENKTMNFYINGEFIKTIGNTDGYSGGVAGLYSGDAVQIAFSDLEISK